MSSVVTLLDAPPKPRDESWNVEIEESLRNEADAWLAAVDAGELTEARWWWLLSWVERMASVIAVTRRAELVELSAFALSLLEDGPVDPREAWVIGPVLRHSASKADLEFLNLIRAGCGRAGSRGDQCFRWLSRVSDHWSSTHREVGHGDDFRFERVTEEADVSDDFMRWAQGEK